MCLRERERTGTEKWVEVCGKPWCRLVFVWLGLHSRGRVPTAPDDSGLSLANILSSDSGDRLNWERLAPSSCEPQKLYQPCVRGCLKRIESAAVTRSL